VEIIQRSSLHSHATLESSIDVKASVLRHLRINLKFRLPFKVDLTFAIERKSRQRALLYQRPPSTLFPSTPTTPECTETFGLQVRKICDRDN
jgi:hypothetical protein